MAAARVHLLSGKAREDRGTQVDPRMPNIVLPDPGEEQQPNLFPTTRLSPLPRWRLLSARVELLAEL